MNESLSGMQALGRAAGWLPETQVVTLFASLGEVHTALGVCLASAQAWEHFEEEWRHALPPGMERFRMADFKARKEGYVCSTWDNASRGELVNTFLEIMNRRIICLFGFTRRRRSGDSSGVLDTVWDGTVSARRPGEQVALVLAGEPPFGHDHLPGVLGGSRPDDPRLRTCSVADPREVLALQAADMVAWKAAKECGSFERFL